MAYTPLFGGGGDASTPAPAAPTASATPDTATAPAGGGSYTPLFSGGTSDTQVPSLSKSGSGGGGFFSGLAQAAGSILSPIGTALNAPEQAVFHGASALGSALGGNLGEAGKTLSQIPGAVIGKQEDQMTPLAAAGQENAKLPFGLHNALNAVGTIAADPLNAVTLGLGPEARAATRAIGASAGGADIVNAIRKGGLASLDEATQATIKKTLTEAAGQGRRPAEEVASKQMEALAQRGQGGLGLHIPGTDVAAHVMGSFDRPEIAKAVADKYPRIAQFLSPDREAANLAAQAAKSDALGEAARVTDNARSLLGLSEKDRGALLSQLPQSEAAKVTANFPERAVEGAIPTEQAAKHVGSAKDLKQGLDKVGSMVRSQLLAFPGTVVNRARRGASVMMLDGVGPHELPGLYKEAADMTGKVRAAETSLGLDGGKLKSQIESAVARSEDLGKKYDVARQTFPVDEAKITAARDEAASKAVAKEQLQIDAEGAAKGKNRYSIRNDQNTGEAFAQFLPAQDTERLAQAARTAREGVTEAGGIYGRPATLDWKGGLAQILEKKGISMDEYRAALAKQGLDPEHAINIRQIVDQSGGNMFRSGEGMRPRSTLLGKIPGYEKATSLPRAGATKVRQAGSAVETLNKTASALHNLDRYGNVESATEHVANVMGDPWKLTHGEKMISPLTPFWGAIRNHIETVARTGFDNPQRLAILEHSLKASPWGVLAQGSGDPIGSSAKVLDAPVQVGVGAAGALGSATGHPFGQGQLTAGLKGIGGLMAGAPAAGARLAAAPEMLGKAPGKAVINAAKTSLPSVQRLPLPGKKADLKSQIERFLFGITTAGG